LPQEGAHLQVAGTYTPLPLERTLIDSGICNGALLVLVTQGDGRKTSPNSAIPQQSEPRWVQPGINTGGIGVTWESLV
jgi:hypothetical protein